MIVESGRIVIEIDGERALATLLAGPEALSAKRSRQDRSSDAKHPDHPGYSKPPLSALALGMKLDRPRRPQGCHSAAPGLIRLLLRAFAIQDRLEQNPDLTLQEDRRGRRRLTLLCHPVALRLAYLAPDIVTAIVDGQQPPGLTANTLMKNTRLPFRWEAQRKRLGFEARLISRSITKPTGSVCWAQVVESCVNRFGRRKDGPLKRA